MLRTFVLVVALYSTAAVADCITEIPPSAPLEMRGAMEVFCREQALIRKKYQSGSISAEEAALQSAQSKQRLIKANADMARADDMRDANEAAAAAALDAAGAANRLHVCQNFGGTNFCY